MGGFYAHSKNWRYYAMYKKIIDLALAGILVYLLVCMAEIYIKSVTPNSNYSSWNIITNAFQTDKGGDKDE